MMIKFSGNLTVKRIENLRFKKDVVQQGCKRESLAGGRYNRTKVSQKSYYLNQNEVTLGRKRIYENWSVPGGNIALFYLTKVL